MYNIENLKKDIDFIKKYNKTFKDTIDKYTDYLSNKYVDNSLIDTINYCDLCEIDCKEILKSIKLQDILKDNNNEKYNELIKEYNKQIQEYNENKEILKDLNNDIIFYYETFLLPLQENLSFLFALNESIDNEINYILKYVSNIFIENNIKIPKNDIDSIINYVYKFNDNKFNEFIDKCNEKIAKINPEKYKSGIEIYENDEDDIEYNVPELEDIVKNIKNQKRDDF